MVLCVGIRDGRCGEMGLGLCISIWVVAAAASEKADPIPKPWPLQFHAQLYQNRTGKLSMIDLWYDYPNGRNLNLIQKQLGSVIHDVEYTNGTSFYYDLEAGTCKVVLFQVGILRPDFLNDATYVGVDEIDGYKCNVWDKADFIRYWEDIETRRPISWLFTTTGMWMHVMKFEEGNVLDDQKWQAPPSCFERRVASTTSSALKASEVGERERQGIYIKKAVVARKAMYHSDK